METIRQRFNQSKLPEMIRTGQLVEQIVADKHPAVPLGGEPYCTRSQYVVYSMPDSTFVVSGHRYLRPDGTLGLSGKLDPKRLWDGKRILYIRSHPP